MSTTVYAKCIPEGIDFEQTEWHPWINVKPTDLPILPQMILGRWIRNRGGVRHDERLNVTVYTYDDETPCHKNGKPRRCQATTFAVNHSETP